MTAKVEMTLDEMELFFQKSLTTVRSRPKRLRKDSRTARLNQRKKMNVLQAEIKTNNFATVKIFLASILTIGSSDEGTPV